MDTKKRRTIKEDLEEIRAMTRRSRERQGADTKSDVGQRAMKAEGTARNFQGGGYEAKSKPDGSKYQGAPISKANLQEYKPASNEQVKPKKPQRRPGAGREDAMNRYMEERKRRKDGDSRVIG